MKKNSLAMSAILLAGLLAARPAAAAVKVASLFQDNMVLQRETALPVWGRAEPGEKVSVTFGGQTASTTTGKEGKWRITLPPCKANATPQEMVIAGANKITIKNVLVGEVWICSGQSNMELAMHWADSLIPAAKSANYPQIRMFTIPHSAQFNPRETCPGAWAVCDPAAALGFSAVGYFFGKELYQALQIPIGLINASWSATGVEGWTARPELEKLPFYQQSQSGKAPADPAALQAALEAKQTYPERFAAWVDRVGAADPGMQSKWYRPDCDTKDWIAIHCPMPVTGNALKEYLGFSWVRREVEIPRTWVGKTLTLRLGPIDDADFTYVNGRMVGNLSTSDAWLRLREYKVPGDGVTSEKVTIAVRVLNTFGATGLFGEEFEYAIFPEPAGGEKPISLAGDWSYRLGVPVDVKANPKPEPPASLAGNDTGAMIFNGMIAPLAPYALRGAIWYQGEANTGNPVEYRDLLPALIQSWRRTWGQEHFHFGVVQLANFMARQQRPIEPESWADLREAQTLALKLPETGLAVITDIGERDNIHPSNKWDVGRRLALWARASAYGEKLVYSGPLYRAAQFDGAQARLSFDHVGAGLVAHGAPLCGFAVAGADKVFHAAQAKIDGETVIVGSDKVNKPVAVRYAWASNPIANLYNQDGLPASPFRTDDWKRAEIRAADEKMSEPQIP